MSKSYRIALYLRLSKEDEHMPDESNSIINQRMLLENYVKKYFEGYELHEFSDDGYSGTNFQRPGVISMLDQAREGKIDCVIVKDFSRFSRDYIELGAYLDQIFPFLGIRFISLNDHYDSIQHGGKTAELDISFKGLLYDLYAKDLSVKVKSSIQARKEQGQYVSAHTPFGYGKAQEDRHRLVIAEDEAEIVRRIFALALEEKTSTEIARLFNRENVPTPIEFKIKKGQTSRTPLGKGFQWNHSMICSILNNPVYAGDMVYHKYTKDEVGGKPRLRPKSEWKIHRDHHVAIISRDNFERVQAQQRQKRNGKAEGRKSRYCLQEKTGYPLRKKTGHPLQGKVICGGCKRAMVLRKSRNPYFYCNKRYMNINVEGDNSVSVNMGRQKRAVNEEANKEAKVCVSSINLMFLEQVILYQMAFEQTQQEKLEQMRREREEEIGKRIKQRVKDKEGLLRKKEVMQRKRLEAYEKSVFEPGYRFPTEKMEIEQTEAMINEIEEEIRSLEEKRLAWGNPLASFFKGGWETAITSEFVEQWIGKIMVYDGEHVEIQWSFKEETASI